MVGFYNSQGVCCMTRFKEDSAGIRVLPMSSTLHALAFAGLLIIAPLALSAVPFASSAMAEVGNPHALANSNRDHDKQALPDQSTESAADSTTAANAAGTGTADSTDGTSTTTDGANSTEGSGTTASDANAGVNGATNAATGARTAAAPADTSSVGAVPANN